MPAPLLLTFATRILLGKVIELNAYDYQDAVNSNDWALVTFTAPWCNHCQNFEPNFEAAAKQLEGDGILFATMNVDQEGNKDVARSLGVKGYPALIIFKNGRKAERESAHIARIRGADDVANFMSTIKAGGECPKDPIVDDTQFDEPTSTPTPTQSATEPTPLPQKTHESAGDSVLELSAASFDNALATHNILLVDFYAPWCGHCKHLEPRFKDAADTLSKEDIQLAKIDHTQDRSIGNRYEVRAFPSLRVFLNGELDDKASEGIAKIREVEDIIHYMREVKSTFLASVATATSSAVEITTEGEWDRLIHQNDVVMAMFYAPWCGHCKRLKPDFASASDQLSSRDITLAQVDATSLQELAQRHNVQGFPTLKIFRDGQFVEDYRGGRSADELVSYMQDVASKETGDSCLDIQYAISNYKKCCARGAFREKPGRQPICKAAKLQL